MEEWIQSSGNQAARLFRPLSQWMQESMDAVRGFFGGLTDLQIVVLILLINGVVVALYLLTHLTKRRWKKGLLLCAFMLAVPIVGPLYLLLAELIQTIQKLSGNREVNMKELSFDQRRVQMILDANVEKERNMVPLEEALIVSNRFDKRTTFLEVLKGEDWDVLGVIRGAVDSWDAEIAHYAAAYMTDMITRVKERESVLRKTFEENPTPESAEAYVRHLCHALETGVFEGVEKRRYLERLERGVLWQMENAPQACLVQDMASLARQWIKMGNMDSAKRWIDRVYPRRDEDLDAFKVSAMYEYCCHDRAALMELLDGVHGSALMLDGEALDWIRYFEHPTQMQA